MGRHAPHSCCDVRGSRRSRATRRTPNGCLATVIRHGNVAIHRSADSPRRGDLAASPPGFPKGLPPLGTICSRKWRSYFVQHMQRASNSPKSEHAGSIRDRHESHQNHFGINQDHDRIFSRSLRDQIEITCQPHNHRRKNG
jgi:hypothetical protein